MRLVKDYMRDDTLRHELNALTRETFGFDFESWVTNGYFEGDYIPYSFEEDGKILANVSANIMTFEQNGKRRNYILIILYQQFRSHIINIFCFIFFCFIFTGFILQKRNDYCAR